MPFRTQLDLSNNRQAKERQRTITQLSGATIFGVPFSAMTSGPDYQNEVITSSVSGLTSTFTGTSATTVYTWAQPNMVLGEPVLSALTPSNSGITQNTDSVFSAWTTTTIDGNTVVLTYSGVSFDVKPNQMVQLAPNLFSGNTNTNVLNYLSAGTLDFTGRTIWADNPEITRTDRLIVSRNPTIGYVLTCIDNEGMVGWFPSSGGTTGGTSTDVFVTGGTCSGLEMTFTNNTGGTFTVTGCTSSGGTPSSAATIDLIASTTSSAYTMTNLVDTVFIDCTTTNITATLPSMIGNGGRVLTVVRTDNTVNTGTLSVGGVGFVQGAASVNVAAQSSITVVCDGVTGWWIK